VSTPKKDLHTFAFPSTPNGQKDILVVKKDGSLSIGPIGESPTVRSTHQNHTDISSHLHPVATWSFPPQPNYMSSRPMTIQPDHEHLPQAVMIHTRTMMKTIKRQFHSRTIRDRIDSKWLQRVLTVSWPRRELVAEDDKSRE
jgi:hypothetical protein